MGADTGIYGTIVEGLIFVACIGRPNIAYAVGVLSQFNNNPSKTHMTAAKGLLRYLSQLERAARTPFRSTPRIGAYGVHYSRSSLRFEDILLFSCVG